MSQNLRSILPAVPKRPFKLVVGADCDNSNQFRPFIEN
jgi:hypothetical protein